MGKFNRFETTNYQLKYDFGNYNSSVVSFIENVYNNSLNLLNEAIINDNYSSYKDIIIKSIGYLEDYLFYMYSFNNEDFFQIFSNLMSKLKAISILPADKCYKYGDCDLENGIVYINPSVESKNGLDYDSRIRLNLCHNLGHITNDIWMSSAKENISNLAGGNDFYKISYRYGLKFLDEAISQNHAENITYYFLGKERPKSEYRYSKVLSGFVTNFDYYGEFQIPITTFSLFFAESGRSIKGFEALDILCKMALKSNFFETIFNMMSTIGYKNQFVDLLCYLGVVSQKYYESYGYRNEINISLMDASEAISHIKDIVFVSYCYGLDSIKPVNDNSSNEESVKSNNLIYGKFQGSIFYGYPPKNNVMSPSYTNSFEGADNIVSLDDYINKSGRKHK